MANFTFTSYEEDNTTSSLSFDADFMGEILEKFEQFLKGSGYHFEGNLEFVTNDYDDEYDSDYDDEEPVHDYAPQSSYAYDNVMTPNFTISEVRPLTTSDVAALQVSGGKIMQGYGAVRPTMAPLGPLTPNDINL
jgi:hypothetical protein